MGVKINSKETLDVNAYSRIIIRGLKGNYIVNVRGEKKDDTHISLSYKLSDSLKNNSDNDKIISIVESFLATTTINSIELSAFYAGCKGEFIKISGTRDMYLQIDDMQLLYSIMKMIKSKYDKDRYDYCRTSIVNHAYGIFLSKNTSSYGMQAVPCEKCAGCDIVDNNCPNYIQFKVMYSNGKITSFDRKFIERFVYDKLWEVGYRASVIEETEDIKVGGVTKIGEAVRGYCIICGNLEIIFTCSTFSRPYIYDLCNNIVNKYNKDFFESKEGYKKRQLKMEGF